MHGHGVRGMNRATLHSFDGIGDPGKFGIMFPGLVPLHVEDDKPFELAETMKDATGFGGDNDLIPAGYTYLGQFVDHDITLDTTPLSQQKADPKATLNFRTPALDLDSLYGDGPGIHPYLYQRDPKNRLRVTDKLLIGHTEVSPDAPPPAGKDVPAGRHDLPRNQVGHALIGDERNDENLLVAQTHLLMLKFHNKVVDMLVGKGIEGDVLFKEARRIVTWHYQWIVLFDFVERLTEPGLVRKIKHEGRRFYRFRDRPYMPAEFAAAAYRLGHSMVRNGYDHNRVFTPGSAFGGASMALLFHFTGKSGFIAGELADSVVSPPRPGAFATLPSNWVIDWRRFYDLESVGIPGRKPQSSKLLDPYIVSALHTLPGFDPAIPLPQRREFSLPFRNLRRGVQIGLPSGQSICRAMGIKPLTPDEIATGPDGAVARKHGMDVETPLWYYVLKEAEVLGKGKRLGPMASIIVAETFLGMVHGDHESFLWLRSNWEPELGDVKGRFEMADLIKFVGDVNPVG
jgi:hypothetical protein